MVDVALAGPVSMTVSGVGELIVGVSAFVASRLHVRYALGACELEGRHQDNEHNK